MIERYFAGVTEREAAAYMRGMWAATHPNEVPEIAIVSERADTPEDPDCGIVGASIASHSEEVYVPRRAAEMLRQGLVEQSRHGRLVHVGL